MNRIALGLGFLLIVAGCNSRPSDVPIVSSTQDLTTATNGASNSQESTETKAAPEHETTLMEARAGFKTKLVRRSRDNAPADPPPQGILRLVRFEAPAGKLAAYLSPDPGDSKKRPAIIWVFGGFSNSIGATAWERQPAKNDQSASAFRKLGIVMMYPSFRGGNDNSGLKECFLGEVNDLLAARDFLAKQPFVDPDRIYLGGHSTGGTMALLAAACSDKFRAIFSFGPTDDVSNYGAKNLTFDLSNPKEVTLRSPERWMNTVRCPTFVFEGADEPSNIAALEAMKQTSVNPKLHFYAVPGATHFSILAPTTALVATQILHDDGEECNIRFSPAELRKPFGK